DGRAYDSGPSETGSDQEQGLKKPVNADLASSPEPHSPSVTLSQESTTSNEGNISQNAAPPTTRSKAPASGNATEDVWAFQAQQRSQSAKAIKAKDVAQHRPSMEELEPLLRKRAAGTLTFNDTLAIQKRSVRDIIGWLQMPTGTHTKTIDIPTAMASLIFDNQALGLDSAIADIVKCERDVPNGILRWGVASEEAMAKLRGASFKIQVARNGSHQQFAMNAPHVLDGFFIDIPQGLHNQGEEQLMFEAMTQLEPRFLWGAYVHVSSSTVMTSSRYRLHFEGSSTPISMQKDGRLVEELLFKGRCLRVYAQGWYFRDNNLVRLDLDAALRLQGQKSTASNATNNVTPATNNDTSATKATKRQKTEKAAEPQWTEVKTKRGKRKSSPQREEQPPQCPSWYSPNMFEALEERVGVIPDEHTLRFGDYTIPMILPKVEDVDGQPQYPTSGNFVCGTKIHKGKPKCVELSLETILAELRDLDSQATIASKNLPAQVKVAASKSSFSLAQLVNDGQVDELCSHLEQSPIEFGLQLHQLFEKDRACFEYFIRQRLLHRWLRATYGGDKTFAQLFSKMSGDNMTRDHVHSIFKSQELFQNLETIDTTIDGDEFSLHRGDLEEVLAVAEVLLAVHAP
ncbi:hypothetical protein DYB32_010923, partial [Aphanomyces invadans]